jgi:hypothetical protein
MKTTNRFDFLDTSYEMDLTNLDRLPETTRWAKELNAQADRIEELMLDVLTDPSVTQFHWEDTLTWRTKQEVLRRRGLSKKEIGDDEFGHLSKKEQDEDEKAYQAFLANEFSEVA